MRGYLQDMVGPTSADPKTGNLVPTGGDSMALFNELRINPSGGLGTVLFTDAGNVWTGQNINLDDLRASYGARIRYNTLPWGRCAGLWPERSPTSRESPGQIHFSIGQAF